MDVLVIVYMLNYLFLNLSLDMLIKRYAHKKRIYVIIKVYYWKWILKIPNIWENRFYPRVIFLDLDVLVVVYMLNYLFLNLSLDMLIKRYAHKKRIYVLIKVYYWKWILKIPNIWENRFYPRVIFLDLDVLVVVYSLSR